MVRTGPGITQYEKECRIEQESAEKDSRSSKESHSSYGCQTVLELIFCKRYKEHESHIQHRHQSYHVEEIEVRHGREEYRYYEKPRLSPVNDILRSEKDQRQEYHGRQEERMPYGVVHRKSAERIYE